MRFKIENIKMIEGGYRSEARKHRLRNDGPKRKQWSHISTEFIKLQPILTYT
jgi:hypothetical protein